MFQLIKETILKLLKTIENYCKALTIKPNFSRAHYSLGQALRLLGKQDEAVTSFQKASKIKPDYPNTPLNLGPSWSSSN